MKKTHDNMMVRCRPKHFCNQWLLFVHTNNFVEIQIDCLHLCPFESPNQLYIKQEGKLSKKAPKDIKWLARTQTLASIPNGWLNVF